MIGLLIEIMTLLGGVAAIVYLGHFLWRWRRLRKETSPPSDIAEKWVDFRYPNDSGIQARLEAEGFQVSWCADKYLARKLEFEGAEVVVETGQDGIATKFRLRTRPENQTLIKTRKA